MGCGEEEVSAGGCFDRLVAVELSAVVDSDGPDAPSGVVDEFDGTAVGGLDGSSGELADDSEAGPTVDEREQAVLVGTEYGVALEVPDTTAVLSSGRSFGDGPLTGETAPGVVVAVAFAASLMGTAEMAVEGAVPLFVEPDVTVDGLMTDP